MPALIRKPIDLMPLTTMLKFLFAMPMLRAIALFSLVLSMGGSNRFLRQTGASVAFIAGGALAASMVQQKEDSTALSQLQAGYKRREATLTTSLDMAMAESETLARQLSQLNAGVADWQTERGLMAAKLRTLVTEQQQLLCELYETAAMEATFQAETVAAKRRIADVEAALTEKTNLATQMLTELEAEASSTFNHFSAKVSTQGNLINELHQQIEGLKQSNAALKNQKLADQRRQTTAPDNLTRHRLFDSLAQN